MTAELGTAVLKLRTDSSALDKGIADTQTKVKGLGGTMSTALGTGAGFAAAQVGMQGMSSGFDFLVGNAMDFEKQMYAVQAATGASNGDMAKMKELALDIGEATSKSSSEAVLAMGELAKAGMPVETILNGGAMAAVQFAEATGIGVPEAAILVSNAMNTWKASGIDATEITNIFAKAANASSVDVRDLGMSLSAVGPLLDSTGVSAEQFAVIMGLFGNNALKGSDAGTSFKAFLSGLTPVTDKAKKSMADLGFSAFDAQGNFKEMPEIIADLDKALAGLTEKQRAETQELWFGSDGLRASNILLKEGVKGYDAFVGAMDKAPDVAEQARIRMQGAAGQIEKLKGSLETISIIIGSVFLPALTAVLKLVTDFLSIMLDLGKMVPKDVWIAIAVAIAVMLTPALVGLAVAAGAAAIAMIAAAAPFILVGAAIAGIVLALKYAYDHWQLFHDAVDSVVSFIRDTVIGVFDTLIETFTEVKRLFMLGVAGGKIGGEFTIIQQAAFALGVLFRDTLIPFWNNLVEAFRLGMLVLSGGEVGGKFTALQQFFIDTAEIIKVWWEGTVKPSLAWLLQAFTDIVAWIVANWPTIRDVIMSVVDDVQARLEGWLQFLRGIVEIVSGVIGLISSLIEGDWRGVWDNAVKIFEGIFDLFIGGLRMLGGRIVAEIIDGISSLPGKMAAVARDAAGRFLDNLSVAGVSVGDVRGFLGRAAGGDVNRGQPYVVGEQGWELFVPSQAGTILSHEESMAAASGGGAGGINVSMPDARIYASDRDDAERSAQDFGWGIMVAARQRGAA